MDHNFTKHIVGAGRDIRTRRVLPSRSTIITTEYRAVHLFVYILFCLSFFGESTGSLTQSNSTQAERRSYFLICGSLFVYNPWLKMEVHLKAVFTPLKIGQMEISCLHFKQYKNPPFITQINDLGRFMNFWVIF